MVARSLGPAGRGDLAIVLVLPAVASQVASLGIPSAATYFMARQVSEWRAIAAKLPMVVLVQSVVAVGLLLGLNQLFLANHGGPLSPAAVTMLAVAPVLIAGYYAQAVLQGIGAFGRWNVYRMAPIAGYTIAIFAAVPFGLTVFKCAVLFAGANVVTVGVLVLYLARRYRANAKPRTNSSAIPSRGSVVRFGVVGFLAQVSPVETFRIDSLVVAALFPSRVVGLYAVALSLSNAPRFIADGVVSVAYPHVAAGQRAHGYRSTKRYLAAAALSCGSAAAAIAIAVPWLVPFLFGRRYSSAIGVTVLLLVAASLISIRRVGSDCLRALGAPGVATAIEVLTLLVLVPAFLTLGRWGSGRGVALSLALSAAIGLAVMGGLLRRDQAQIA